MEDLVFKLIDDEKRRQSEGLELIPSENYVSRAVLAAVGSVLTNKYSEGYPNFSELGFREQVGASVKESMGNLTEVERKIIDKSLPNYRYYGGQENIDKIERLAIRRACELFRADHANVQPHSGANANEAVYFAWCEPGDKILAMDLSAGGHLTHGAPVTRAGKIYDFISYGVRDDGDIDYAELEEKALAELPRLILLGYSAWMKIPDFKRVAEIKKRVEEKAKAERGEKFEVLLMADMAHVAGLIAGGAHPNPLEYGFQVMTSTTHKTLRGPRGGLILSMGKVSSPLKRPERSLENLPTLIDRAVFPGTQGGPLEHVVAGKAVALGEALRPEFKLYVEEIRKNARVLAEELKRLGFVLQGGGTENHLILIDMMKSFGVDGKFYEQALDAVGLTLNANSLPRDKAGAFRPSGARLGTPAMTTRGLGEQEMRRIAGWMFEVAKLCQEAGEISGLTGARMELERIRGEVRALALKFPVPGA